VLAGDWLYSQPLRATLSHFRCWAYQRGWIPLAILTTHSVRSNGVGVKSVTEIFTPGVNMLPCITIALGVVPTGTSKASARGAQLPGCKVPVDQAKSPTPGRLTNDRTRRQFAVDGLIHHQRDLQ